MPLFSIPYIALESNIRKYVARIAATYYTSDASKSKTEITHTFGGRNTYQPMKRREPSARSPHSLSASTSPQLLPTTNSSPLLSVWEGHRSIPLQQKSQSPGSSPRAQTAHGRSTHANPKTRQEYQKDSSWQWPATFRTKERTPLLSTPHRRLCFALLSATDTVIAIVTGRLLQFSKRAVIRTPRAFSALK